MFGMSVSSGRAAVRLIVVFFGSVGGLAYSAIQVSSLKLTPTSVFGGSPASLVVTLSAAAPKGGATVTLTDNRPGAVQLPATTVVKAGAKSATVPVTTVPVDYSVAVTLGAGTGTQKAKTATLTVKSATLTSVTIVPSTVAGGATPNIAVKLGSPAGPAGVQVLLRSSNTDVAEPPDSLEVSAGEISTTGMVKTDAVSAESTVTITGTVATSTQKAKLKVEPPGLNDVSASPDTLNGGNATQLTVNLDGQAGPGGIEVSLTSSNSSLATPPKSLSIAEDEASGTVTIPTGGVDATTQVTITVTLGKNSLKTTLTLNPATLKSINVDPQSIGAGSSGTLTVKSDGDVGSKRMTVNLQYGTYVSGPATATISKGNSATVTFTATSAPTAESTTITATSGTQSISVHFQVVPDLSIVVAPATVVGGLTATLTVTLLEPAKSGGETISLSSSDMHFATVPKSVEISAGDTTGTSTVSTTATTGTEAVTLTATDPSGHTATTMLTVTTAAQLTSVWFGPGRVRGGSSTQVNVVISSAAGPGGVQVKLSTKSTGVTVPATIMIPEGSTTGSGTVKTSTVTQTTWAVVTALVSNTVNAAFVVANGSLDVTWPSPYGDILNSGRGLGTVTTGSEVWHANLGDWGNGIPIVGKDASIYTVDLTNTLSAFNSSGVLEWSIPNVSSWVDPTVGSDGTIYVSLTDGTVQALTPGGAGIWNVRLPMVLNGVLTKMGGSVAIGADGTLYVPGFSAIFALSPSGSLKWMFDTDPADDGGGALTPTIGQDGTLYVVGAGNYGTVFALNPDGSRKWYRELAATTSVVYLSHITLGPDGTLYSGSTDGHMYALNSDGTTKWSLSLEGSVSGCAIAPDGGICVVTDDGLSGNLYGLDPTNGMIHGTLALDVAGLGILIGSDGSMFVMGGDGIIYAVNSDGTLRWKGPGAIGDSLGFGMAADGTMYFYQGKTLMAIH